MQFMDTTTLHWGGDVIVAERSLNADGSQLLRPKAKSDFATIRQVLAGTLHAKARADYEMREKVAAEIAAESPKPLPNPFLKKGPVRVLEPTYTGDSVRGCLGQRRFRRLTESTQLENIEAWTGRRRAYRSWKERRPNKFKRNSVPF
jgi:hypothetical protein